MNVYRLIEAISNNDRVNRESSVVFNAKETLLNMFNGLLEKTKQDNVILESTKNGKLWKNRQVYESRF